MHIDVFCMRLQAEPVTAHDQGLSSACVGEYWYVVMQCSEGSMLLQTLGSVVGLERAIVAAMMLHIREESTTLLRCPRPERQTEAA